MLEQQRRMPMATVAQNQLFVWQDLEILGDLERLQLALKYLPDDKYTNLNRGLCYHNLEINDSSLMDYNKVISMYPKYELAYNNRGYLYFTEKKYNLALDDYNTALQIKPEYTTSLWNRGDLYMKTGEYQKAINDYSKAYQLNNDFYNILYHIGVCYEELNNKIFALKYFNDFLSKAGPEHKYYDDTQKRIKKLK